MRCSKWRCPTKHLRTYPRATRTSFLIPLPLPRRPVRSPGRRPSFGAARCDAARRIPGCRFRHGSGLKKRQTPGCDGAFPTGRRSASQPPGRVHRRGCSCRRKPHRECDSSLVSGMPPNRKPFSRRFNTRLRACSKLRSSRTRSSSTDVTHADSDMCASTARCRSLVSSCSSIFNVTFRVISQLPNTRAIGPAAHKQ